ncbi:aldose 1-epimerase [Ruania halotolerans]|uniref:aldose 1-epimerase n=1 Tax=Ruania halotolerans TaxID=2897773 RepID=UPI001E416483|nr:aldose 1-epimerase [Ruania halotolerans]UFU07617.1 aldose 1-epimerase [Ruania halotolerans]
MTQAQVSEVDLGKGWTGLRLSSAELEVTLIPQQGCDVHALVDRRTGVDVLWKTPWAMPPAGTGRWNAEDEAEWLERFSGGWQLLCPNGGDASEAPGGLTWGWHGEASRIPWQLFDSGVEADGAVHARLRTRLTRAPLQIERRVAVRGAVLSIEESVTNTSPDPIEIMWSHHPAFGAPLIGPATRIYTSAATITADAKDAGTDLEPSATAEWPHPAPRAGQEPADFSRIPERPRATLAYLGDFASDGWYAMVNPEIDLGVGLRWDADLFPHAWYWQELRASAGAPWWGEVYVTAIEPASTIPGHGIAHAKARGANLVRLAGGATRSTTIEATTFAPDGEVRRIGPAGAVEHG